MSTLESRPRRASTLKMGAGYFSDLAAGLVRVSNSYPSFSKTGDESSDDGQSGNIEPFLIAKPKRRKRNPSNQALSTQFNNSHRPATPVRRIRPTVTKSASKSKSKTGSFVYEDGDYRYDHDAKAVLDDHPFPVTYYPADSPEGKGYSHDEVLANPGMVNDLMTKQGIILIRGNAETRLVAADVLSECASKIHQRYGLDVHAAIRGESSTIDVTDTKGSSEPAPSPTAAPARRRSRPYGRYSMPASAMFRVIPSKRVLFPLADVADKFLQYDPDVGRVAARTPATAAATAAKPAPPPAAPLSPGAAAREARRQQRDALALEAEAEAEAALGMAGAAPGDDAEAASTCDLTAVLASPAADTAAVVDPQAAPPAASPEAPTEAPAASVSCASLRSGLYRYLSHTTVFKAAGVISRAVLGEGFKSRGFKCMWSTPQTLLQTPHRDTLAVEINCFFALTHMLPATGSTVFFPGSHDTAQEQRPPVQFELFPGDLVVFNSTLGHYGTKTTTHRPLGFFSFKGRSRMRTLSQRVLDTTKERLYKFDADDPRFPLIFKNNEGDSYSV